MDWNPTFQSASEQANLYALLTDAFRPMRLLRLDSRCKRRFCPLTGEKKSARSHRGCSQGRWVLFRHGGSRALSEGEN